MTTVAGIYAITHADSGRVYVGSAVDARRRWSDHRRALDAGRHPNRYLQSAWAKYGAGAFHFGLVEVVADLEKLTEREQAWLDATRAAEREAGFNLTPTAGSLLGFRFSDEQRGRVSAALRGKPKSPEHRAALWANREVDDEFRDRMRRNGQAGRGRPKSAAHREAIGVPQRGEKNHFAKLTDSDVVGIRTRLAAGERGRAIAADYGIHESTVSEIKHRRKWQHIPDPSPARQ